MKFELTTISVLGQSTTSYITEILVPLLVMLRTITLAVESSNLIYVSYYHLTNFQNILQQG